MSSDSLETIRRDYLRWLDWEEGNTALDYPNTYYWGAL